MLSQHLRLGEKDEMCERVCQTDTFRRHSEGAKSQLNKKPYKSDTTIAKTNCKTTSPGACIAPNTKMKSERSYEK